MKLGIICAIEEEIRLIKEDINLKSTDTIANREFYCGELYGQDVVLVMSRIGKVAAALTTTILIEKFAVDTVIFMGVAGGISPELNVGDAVVADSSIQHDFIVPGRPLGQVPIINKSHFETDTTYKKLALDSAKEYIEVQMLKDIPQNYLQEFNITAPKVVSGVIASGDEFICTKEKNKWLYDNIKDCKCAEMEGAATAQVCYEYGVPYTLFRIISDSANDDAGVDFDSFVLNAASHFTKGVLKAFVKKLI